MALLKMEQNVDQGLLASQSWLLLESQHCQSQMLPENS
jgi:hypothetical protein